MSNQCKEEVKKFWELCGFKFFEPITGGAIDVIDPDGTLYLSPPHMAIPKTNLTNLFRWVVPALLRKNYRIEIYMVEEDSAVSIYKGTDLIIFRCLPKLEDALFEALYWVLKKNQSNG